MELNSISIATPNNNCSIAWRNLRFEVKNFFGSNKVILKRLNGHLNSNTLNGFLGPSGAGKTTLLNCLNGTLRSGITSDSEIYLNQRQQQVPVVRYIEQHVHETIIGKMTIQQVLYYAFRFKNERRHLSQMDKHIASVLKELLLDEDILKTKFENCSGGEQRRIAIAQELMSLDKPTFLFVDEPTTGLDSNAAYLMMQCLRRLADSSYPVTVLVSIHTPNSDIMALFDKVYILAKGGVCIYSDSPKFLKSKLEKNLGLENYNEEKPVIEEYLKIACYGIQNETVRQLADSTLIEENEKIHSKMDQLKFLSKGIQINHKSFAIGDLLLQLYRMFHIVFAIEYHKFLFQLLFFTIVYTIISTIFDWKMTHPNTCFSFNPDDEKTLNYTCKDKLHAESYTDEYTMYLMFATVISQLTIACTSTMLFMPMLKIFHNEHRNKWYSMSTFYWSFAIVRFLEMCLVSLHITFMIYFTVDHLYLDNYQFNWLRFGNFLYFIWLMNFYLQTYGHLLSLIFLGKLEVAMVSAELFVTCIQFFTGFLFDMEKMKIPIVPWFKNLFPSDIPTNGLMYSAFGLQRCDTEKEFSFVLQDFGLNIDNVYSDCNKFLINILIVRIITIGLMYYRFSFIKSTNKLIQSDLKTMKLIDYEDKSIQVEKINSNKIHRIKHEDELKFEDFARHKIIVAWRSITLFASKSIYEIRSTTQDNENEKLILRNLNGQFRFGTLNALMGTSGAGKTSLLKILNGRSKTRLSAESQFYLSKFTPIRTSYITQEVSEHLFPGLSAKQSLVYASKLKNVNDNVDHEHIASHILEELDLQDTADTMVQNCSGGQRKRLALGLELTSVRMPNLICIDEPTSGLDSNSSEVVISCLRRLTHTHNITIICSIHQPNIEVLMMFDQLYMLAKGGVCIYSGRPNDIHKHLSHASNRIDHQAIFPVEELIKYSCLKYTDPTVKELVRITNMEVLQENDQLPEQTQPVLDGIPLNRNRFTLKSVWILILRYWLYFYGYLYTNWAIYAGIYLFYGFALRLMFHPRIALHSGCISLEDDFNNTCNQTEDKDREDFELGVNFKFTYSYDAIFLFLILLQTAIMFSKESVYFFNEHRNGWYSSGAFYLMKSIVENIQIIVVLPVYVYLINIYEPIFPGIYFYLLGFFLLGTFAIQSLAHLLALLTNGDIALMGSITPGLVMFLIIIGNLGPPVKRLHYIYKFLSNFSMIRFTAEALLLLQYGFDRCKDKEVQKILYSLGLEHDEYFFECILMLIFNTIFYRLIAFTFLFLKSNPFENRRGRSEKILNYHQQKLIQSSNNVLIPGLSCHHEFSIKKIEI